MDGWMDGWVDGWMDGWMYNEYKYSAKCIFRKIKIGGGWFIVAGGGKRIFRWRYRV